MTGTVTAAGANWQAWQASWDRQQEWYLPDREERFRVMLDMVEAAAGAEPRVLDLACGTGSISDRVRTRFPGATSTGIDLDPALLTIARGYFAQESRVEFVTADLRDPDWVSKLPHTSYDAVLTATALHWLTADALRVLYRQVAGIVREGGVFMNADHMPVESTPRINAVERRYRKAQQQREKAAGVQDWADWWRMVAADEVLAGPAAERFKIFENPTDSSSDHKDGNDESPQWHAAALRDAGFAEARPVWCSVTDALVLGLK
ncbi:class I SAM-dependent methyltransferase [Streptomyces zagrosensis]|uniref:Trans-aconitate methyltransferase n=1 Tax=Streptomyces zagrosensis TaxID=1042984 RepID=A0A7W9QBK6_9ACTN|nr:class I SAM-dependent methyltransferase [Streptomyces zagrosensis]MBB5936894.1 trans-aconitate methyltransferase [Streptomyces zagrosensis]